MKFLVHGLAGDLGRNYGLRFRDDEDIERDIYFDIENDEIYELRKKAFLS